MIVLAKGNLPKNVSARIIDCDDRAARKPLLSEGIIVDWHTNAPTKFVKSSDPITTSFTVKSEMLLVQRAIFLP